jgi:spermidine synthase
MSDASDDQNRNQQSGGVCSVAGYRKRPTLLLHAGTVLLSAFLLFTVQLIVSKYFVIWFGGSSSVWITAMLFFQAALLGGYGYSHWLTSRFPPAVQAHIHSALLALAAVVLGFQYLMWGNFLLPNTDWKPRSPDFPALKLIGLLALCTGVTFFVTATTTSLIQVWFSRAFPGRSPFPLYATSNAGSLFALLAYPLLVEPFVGLQTQVDVWGAAYFIFILMCLLAARGARCASVASPVAVSAKPAEHSKPVDGFTGFLWVLLPLSGGMVFLATTNWITQEAGALPILWSLPLALYLLTFFITFSGIPYRRHFWIVLAVISVAAAIVARLRGFDANQRWFEAFKFIAPLAACMTVCMLCHGELHRLRPESNRLTAFNFSISLGGVLGGVLVAVLAPLLFNDITEFPVALVVSGILVWVCLEMDWKKSRDPARKRFLGRALASILILGLSVGLCYQPDKRRVAHWRTFHGTSMVRKTEVLADGRPCPFFQLYHGRVRHGTQVGSPHNRTPTAYFAHTTGLGRAILNLQTARPDAMSVGIIGLGAGTIAAYGREGDSYRFYEIDDAVIRIAKGEKGCFSYLEDSPAKISVVQGDGRTSLENELRAGRPNSFDLLILDAFSGDSPPNHLGTKEAFNLYLANLAPDGVIAVNISNRFYDFRRAYEPLTSDLGLSMRGYYSPDDGIAYSAVWLFIAREEQTLEALGKDIPLQQISRSNRSNWAPTDDLNSLLPLLHWF